MSENNYESIGSIMSFGDGVLHVDMDSPIAKPLHRSALSPSTSNKLGNGCQASWAVDRLLPWSSQWSDANEIGSSSHAVLEELFNMPAQERTRDQIPGLIDSVYPRQDLVVPTDPTDIMTWRGTVASYTSALFSFMNPQAIEVIETEKHVDGVEINGVQINGFVDMLTTDGVLDWKFKTKPPRILSANSKVWQDYHEQQRLYVLALRELGYDPQRAVLSYVNHTTFDEVSLAPGALDLTAKRFAASWSELKRTENDGTFTMKPTGLCGWCPLVSVCPSAKEGAEAKVAKAEIGPLLNIRTTPRTVTAEAPTDTPQESTVTNNNAPARYTEDYPKNSKVPFGQHSLNGSDMNAQAYGASGVMNYITEARRMLAKQSVLVVTAQMVRNLAITLAILVHKTQSNLTDNVSNDINDGINKLSRQALYTALEMRPLPYGGDQAAWDDWNAKMLNEMSFLVTSAFWIFDNTFNPEALTAYSVLATAQRREN